MMRKKTSWLLALALCTGLVGRAGADPTWSVKDIEAWHEKQGWPVGANFLPSTAINQLEMWQAETFDAKTIDRELGMAHQLGMNTVRVFLHDLVWRDDPEGFKQRIDQFLTIADRHKIRPMIVLFDSVWNPDPRPGKQPAPTPGVHNSGWVQSPGRAALEDPAEYPRLEAYVKGVVGAFGKDPRIASWDLWNEPDNTNGGSYGKLEPKNKLELVGKLLPQVFAWARAAKPTQPLTSGVWQGDWSSLDKLTPIQRTQLTESDFISFHNYDDPKKFASRVEELNRLSTRPKYATEYMARGNKSTFFGIMPVLKRMKVGGYNWGFVQGKAQTEMPWDSWQKPYVHGEPPLWFHEIYRKNGKPYSPREVKFIRRMTGAGKPVAGKPVAARTR
jgi:hypothetical protein